MSKRNGIEIEGTAPTSGEIAAVAIIIGVCCAVRAYVPVCGATPIALGLCIVAWNALGRWAARRRS